MKTPPAIGEVFSVPYPFSRCEVEKWEGDEIGIVTYQSWRPGTSPVMDDRGEEDSFAEGMGEMRLTVVGVYQPHGFPTRVFYTRKWVDPVGSVFGKGGCHCRSLAQFRRLASGYRHRFELRPEQGQEGQ